MFVILDSLKYTKLDYSNVNSLVHHVSCVNKVY